MTATGVEQGTEPGVEEATGSNERWLVAIVGFDGSEPAYRALDAATRLISGRAGTIEIVYVAHTPIGSELSAEAKSEVLRGFDDVEQEFAEIVATRLTDVEARWHFHRRDGLVAHELLAVAGECSRDYGGKANVVIIVGSAMHTYHHVVGSVPVALVRHATYPIVVVP